MFRAIMVDFQVANMFRVIELEWENVMYKNFTGYF